VDELPLGLYSVREITLWLSSQRKKLSHDSKAMCTCPVQSEEQAFVFVSPRLPPCLPLPRLANCTMGPNTLCFAGALPVVHTPAPASRTVSPVRGGPMRMAASSGGGEKKKEGLLQWIDRMFMSHQDKDAASSFEGWHKDAMTARAKAKEEEYKKVQKK
jgi:hypothetical protein